jgi:hypothetical protein
MTCDASFAVLHWLTVFPCCYSRNRARFFCAHRQGPQRIMSAVLICLIDPL